MSITFAHGAQWVRVDVHLHTKADREFKFTGEENSFVAQYVAALKQAGISLGVVTNHNKFDFAEFKALRKAARKEDIALLPGVELSIGDGANGIHTLIVFADDWITNGDRINPFLSGVFEGRAPQEYEMENGRTSTSLVPTINKLDACARDFFLIFAHVEQRSGLWAELDGGRLEDIGRNEAVRRRTLGFQKVRTHDGAAAGKPSREKVKQWLVDWYPAELEGSDPKSIEQIGKGKGCSVKLGELSYAALKFALSDPVARVATEPPPHLGSHVRSVRFDGGTLDGQTIQFSPELNTLIGIRGSGKSSIIEAIRYALDLNGGQRAQDPAYKKSLITHTLRSGGKVTVTVRDKLGKDYTITRILGEQPNVYQSEQLLPRVSIQETILHRPLYFGQKDLSSSGEGFEDDLIERLVGDSLNDLRKSITEQQNRVRQVAEAWFRLKQIPDQKAEQERELADAEFRLQKFLEFGLADKLKKQSDFDHDARAIAAMVSKFDAWTAALERIINEHEDELKNTRHHTSQHNGDFFLQVLDDLNQGVETLERIKLIRADAQIIADRLRARVQEFELLKNALTEEFAETRRKIEQELKAANQSAIEPDEFKQQELRKMRAQQKLDVLTKQESIQVNAQDHLLTEIDALNRLWHEEFTIIKRELDQINAGNGALHIEAVYKGNTDRAAKFMQDRFKGSNIRSTTVQVAMDGHADFGSLLRNILIGKSPAVASPELFERTFMENLTDLITFQVPNRFVIRYHGKELQHHSLGQRASALLLFILNQRKNDIIIIDQPEDDLDNQTIYQDVIRLVRKLKPSTQFIFATHNANFPVLGDAEQVIACTYQNNTITMNSGSIDAQPVQEAIINIMEGGNEAFGRRREVYNLWKPQN
jgi:chromosome segregation protein